jgi:hypothetical protein
MAIGVKVNFEHIYELDSISDDLRIATFQSQLQGGGLTSLTIKISKDSHELLPDVYNLAYGPLKDGKHIDDKAEIPHQDYSRVFSTILLSALKYLITNPDHYLGVDGSENLRAWYYWRFLQRNYDYLAEHFDMFGLKYYVRISRFGKYQYDDPFDFEDIQPHPDRIVKMDGWPREMYNYFIFRLKESNKDPG